MYTILSFAEYGPVHIMVKWPIVHTLRKQLLLESLMYHFKTLQLRYRHIKDVHVEVNDEKIFMIN